VSKWVGGDRWHAQTQTAVLETITASGRSTDELEQADPVWAASADDATRWLAMRLLIQRRREGKGRKAMRDQLQERSLIN
jgi:hypothetical protein